MVDTAVTRVTRYGGNRHCIYLRSDLVEDSAFPFNAKEEVVVRIEDDRLVVERAPPEARD